MSHTIQKGLKKYENIMQNIQKATETVLRGRIIAINTRQKEKKKRKKSKSNNLTVNFKELGKKYEGLTEQKERNDKNQRVNKCNKDESKK